MGRSADGARSSRNDLIQFRISSLLATIAIVAAILAIHQFAHLWLVTCICLGVILHQGFVWRSCRWRIEVIATAAFVANLTGVYQLMSNINLDGLQQ